MQSISATFLRTLAVLAMAGALPVLPNEASAEAAPIFLDGTFADWTGPIDHVDPSGDGGSSGIDFRALDVSNDDHFLFVRFETTVDVRLQDGSSIALYLDTDMNAATGLAVGEIGAELEWNFGDRSGVFGAGGTFSIRQNDIRLRQLPSVTANEFEIAIARDAKPDGITSLFAGATVRLLLRDTGPGGDQAPNESSGLTYSFDPTPIPDPLPVSFDRLDPGDVRIVTWNTRDLEGGSGFDPVASAQAGRVLSAIAPDVICFQEIYDATAEDTRSLVDAMLPDLGPWSAARRSDCHVVSRFPLLQSWALDGNLAVLLDTEAALGTNLLIVAAHLPCCTNDSGRQQEADHIMAFLRDAMTPGGSVDVPVGTAFMIAGDLNLVGFAQQLATLLDGDIVDEGRFGPDFAPDWDGTSLADVISSQTERRFAYTWRNDNSSFAPGRLDFILYSDSVLDLANHFIVYSPEMSAAERAATGIEAGDVTGVSDHLPHVADFRPFGGVVAVARAAPGGLAIQSAFGRGELNFTLELGFDADVEIEVFDVGGRRVTALFGGPRRLKADRYSLRWDGRGHGGAVAPSGVYLAKVRAEGRTGTHQASAKWVLVR